MSALADFMHSFWREIAERPDGPLAFRFYFQPVVSASLALRDGLKDARTGNTPYFWTIVRDSERRKASLKEGLAATSMVLSLAVFLDIAYQYVVIGRMRPLEAIVVALALGFAPYLLLRGPFNRLGRLWMHSRQPRSRR